MPEDVPPSSAEPKCIELPPAPPTEVKQRVVERFWGSAPPGLSYRSANGATTTDAAKRQRWLDGP